MTNVSCVFAVNALACAISAVSSMAVADVSTTENANTAVEDTDKIVSTELAEESDSLALEKVVVTGQQLSRYGATKSDIPIVETSRSVSVIDAETFQTLGALSLDDTLSYTSGVVGDTFGFSTRGDFPKVRGFDAAEYRDGQQVLFGYYNNTRSDVYFLEQVEVLKGPASVLYGKGTPGGIVNAISKLAGDGHDNEVVLDFGSDSRQQVSADISTELAEGLYARTVGFYRDSGTQVDHVNDDAIGFVPSVTFVNDTTTVTGMVEYIDRKSDTSHQFLPIQATGCLNSQIDITPRALLCQPVAGRELSASTYLGNAEFNRYDSKSVLVSLLGSHQLNDFLEIEGVIRHKDAKVKYNQAWVGFPDPRMPDEPRIMANGEGGRTYYLSDASSEQLAVDFRLRADVETGLFEHQLVAGLAYQDVETDNDIGIAYGQDSANVFNPQGASVPLLFQSGQPFIYREPNTFKDKGFYINDQISFNNWKFNVGLRYDEVEAASDSFPEGQKDDAISSSVGILYAFDFGFSPYLSYAESFEPVLGAVDDENGNKIPHKPREGRLTELGFKYQPQSSSTYFTFAWFDIEESNLSNPLSEPDLPQSQLAGVGTSQGFELETFFALGDFDVKSNLTIMDTNSADDTPFGNIPEKQLSTWLNYNPEEGALAHFRSGVGMRYVGDNESHSERASVITDSYTVFDAMLGYDIDNWAFQLNARNLADKRYYSTCTARGSCFPGEARSVVARVAYRF